MKILVKVSGSISAYKVCDLVSQLKKEKHEIRVASSESALNFVGSSTWEGLSSEPVFTDDFSPNRRMDHIYLNDWADLVVLAPATAQTLDSLAQGVGTNVLTTLFLARKQETPYLVFPAMNPRMWESSTVQDSVEKLSRQRNLEVFSPSEGRMACGHVGSGRLNEVDEILDQIYKKFKTSSMGKALVTFGGTSESIDDVRMITNFSSGQTGLTISEALKNHYSVTALGSESAWCRKHKLWGVERLSFRSSQDLKNQIYDKISSEEYELIVHAAAVSDFIPESSLGSKISSEQDFRVEWRKAPKILESLREKSLNKGVKIVSFKLTHNQPLEVVNSKIQQQLKGASDFVVHNELFTVQEGSHPYSIWEKSMNEVYKSGVGKIELARDLCKIGGL